MKTAALTILAAGLFVYPFGGYADEVPPPPERCPEGARGQSSHCGATCEPWTCRSDADCAGLTCQERRLCVGQIECRTYTGSISATVVSESCGDGGGCDSGSCQTLRVCGSAAPTPSAAPSTGGSPAAPGQQAEPGGRTSGGCQVGGQATAGAADLALLSLFLVGLALRRMTR